MVCVQTYVLPVEEVHDPSTFEEVSSPSWVPETVGKSEIQTFQPQQVPEPLPVAGLKEEAAHHDVQSRMLGRRRRSYYSQSVPAYYPVYNSAYYPRTTYSVSPNAGYAYYPSYYGYPQTYYPSYYGTPYATSYVGNSGYYW